MKKSACLRALAFTAGLVFLLPSWGVAQEPADESAEAPVTAETAAIAARRLVDQGRFGEALDILRPLQQALPNEPNVMFLRGLAASGGARNPGLTEEQRDALLDEAITAFRTMLIDRPELIRVRLELALAFFLKGDDSLSRRHFEQVLAGNPPEAGRGQHPQLPLANSRAAGAGASTPASRWHRTPISAPVRKSGSSTSAASRFGAIRRNSRHRGSVSRYGQAVSTSTR